MYILFYLTNGQWWYTPADIKQIALTWSLEDLFSLGFVEKSHNIRLKSTFNLPNITIVQFYSFFFNDFGLYIFSFLISYSSNCHSNCHVRGMKSLIKILNLWKYWSFSFPKSQCPLAFFPHFAVIRWRINRMTYMKDEAWEKLK